jgi:hypothetical protein
MDGVDAGRRRDQGVDRRVPAHRAGRRRYHVIARNEGRTFQRDLKVITGVDGEVEVLAR